MGTQHRSATPHRAAGLPPTRVELSRAARRDVRRAAVLAREADLYAFRIHHDKTITWIPRRERPPRLPGSKSQGDAASAQPRVASKRSQRSSARAQEHAERMRRAHDFRVRRVVAFWRLAAAAPPPPPPTLPPPPSQQLPPPPTPPAPTPETSLPLPLQPPMAPPSPPPPTEPMDDERAHKRAQPSPTAGASPAEPRAKRALPLPPMPPPPPTAPPSLPSTTSSSTSTSTTTSSSTGRASRPDPVVRGSHRTADTEPQGSVSPPGSAEPALACTLPPSLRPPCDYCGAEPFFVAEGRGLCQRCASAMVHAADGSGSEADSDC